MVRFGIIGAGQIAVKFCQAIKLTHGARLVAVASKSLDRAAAFARSNNVSEFYGSYEEMLKNSDIDAVYIATTCNYHYENCLLCIEYKKAVLCEKSMVLHKYQAEHIFKKARENNVFVMEAMWSVFLPTIQKVKQWIAQGRIGDVHIANYIGGIAAKPDNRIFSLELGGGALYDLAVYPIEIVLSLIPQKLIDVKSDIIYGQSGVDVTNNILLKFELCTAALQCTAHSRIPSPSGFYGTKGYIQLAQTHRCERCELYDDNFNLVESYSHPIENGFEFQIAEVRDCITLGKIQSDIMPHSLTLKCLDIFESCFNK